MPEHYRHGCADDVRLRDEQNGPDYDGGQAGDDLGYGDVAVVGAVMPD